MHKIKTHLETLTTNELIKMADSMGIDIPPDFERIFVIQELLEADDDSNLWEDENSFAEPEDSPEINEMAPLPNKYNVNYLEVLLRDPLWVFVYWEINSLDRKVYESSPDFKGYFLHIISLSFKDGMSATDPFSILVDNADTSWRIYLSPEIASFQVNLCVSWKERNEIIISSKPVRVPRVFDSADDTFKNSSKYPMLSLSGIEEFEILRNIDKIARTHRFSGM
jgi:hypothetical protein